MWHECITYPEDPPEVYSEPEPTTQYYHTQTFVGRRELISQNCSSVSLPHAIKPFGAIADVRRPYVSDTTSPTACFPVNLTDRTFQTALGMRNQRTLEGSNSQEQTSITQLPTMIR